MGNDVMRFSGRLLVGGALLGILGATFGCNDAGTNPTATTAPAATATTEVASAAQVVGEATATPIPLLALKVDPIQGYVGEQFTVVGEGLPPGKQAELQWVGWEAVHVTAVSPDNVQYVERKYSQERATLARATVDAQGKATFVVNAPEDHGEAHDMFVMVDGKDVAKGGYRIMRSVEISSTSGAIGSLITITVKGMATSYYQSTMSVQWDNAYTGYISAVTTKGTGVATIRAAGPVGTHIIQVVSASQGTPYLNSYDNARNWHIFSHLPPKFVYTVTADNGAPAPVTEWPDASNVAKLSADAPRTTSTTSAEVRATLAPLTVQPASSPVLTKVDVSSKGLPADTELDMVWVTARGNRTSGSGWITDLLPLGKVKTAGDGSLQANFVVPDDLGGWHTVRVMQGEKLLAEAPYYVERSLVQVTPRKVKAGETITIQLKGVGWTELDNGVAVTYDNAYVGYGCGFSSNGTLNFLIPATGGPGTHIIDLYPMIYEGHANKQVFNFQIPMLTSHLDNPGLGLGYKFPVIRIAVEVVP